MEATILNSLDFGLHRYTTYDLCMFLYTQGVLFPGDQIVSNGKSNSPNPKVVGYFRRFVEFFCDFCLQEVCFIDVDFYLLACSVLASARKQMHVSPVWGPEMELLTGVKIPQMHNVLELIDLKYRLLFPAVNPEPVHVPIPDPALPRQEEKRQSVATPIKPVIASRSNGKA